MPRWPKRSSPARSPARRSTSSARSRSRTRPTSACPTCCSRRTSPARPTRRRRPSASSSPCRCATTSSSASCRTPSICPRSRTRSTSRSRPTSRWLAASDASSRTPRPGNLENIQITYTGRIAQGKTDLIRNAAIAGIFADTEGENSVNRINAAAIAQERGIRIQEDKKEFVTGGSARC